MCRSVTLPSAGKSSSSRGSRARASAAGLDAWRPPAIAISVKKSRRVTSMATLARGRRRVPAVPDRSFPGHYRRCRRCRQASQRSSRNQQRFAQSQRFAQRLFIGGHIHLFETLSFGPARPPQLVVGNGGTLLDPTVTTPLTGLEMAGLPVASGSTLDSFGFVTIDRQGPRWRATLRDVDGEQAPPCTLNDDSLLRPEGSLVADAGDAHRLPLIERRQEQLELGVFDRVGREH